MENKTILISRTDSIGDVMLTLPVAGVLKSHFPGCRIIFLGRAYTRAILECCTHVDVVADWDEIKKLPQKEQAALFMSWKADVIVHVFPNREVAKLARAAGIPERIGTSHRGFHWLTCNRRVNFSRRRSHLHEAQLNLKLLGPLGITRTYSIAELKGLYGFTRIRPLPPQWAGLVDKERFNLILHPRSKGSAREWGLENFSALIRQLPPEKFKVFVTGTKEDGISMSAFLTGHASVTDLTGKLSLEELVSFISACDGLVAASTGPLHIAAALGKKAIGIYAPMRPIHPGRWAPIGERAVSLVLEKACSDCRKSMNCHCIREITPARVLEALSR
jgi:ADP-heptose:LPS heptosyltransferase